MCCPPTMTQWTIFSASATEIQWCNPCENTPTLSLYYYYYYFLIKKKKGCERWWWCMGQNSEARACVCIYIFFFSYLLLKKALLSLQLPNNFPFVFMLLAKSCTHVSVHTWVLLPPHNTNAIPFPHNCMCTDGGGGKWKWKLILKKPASKTF